jgi:signal transduction histidine kinase
MKPEDKTGQTAPDGVHAAAPAPPLVAPQSAIRNSQARVLIVDDEKSIRLVLRSFLCEAGYDVEVAEDADRARQALSAGVWDVVLSDIVLPGVSGVALLKEIRQAAPDVQVIMMTGEPTIETAAEAVRAGAADYLAKPIPGEAVLRAVASAAKVKALDDERRRLAEANRQYQERLEELVKDRTQALQKALDELERTQGERIRQERLNALGQMVSGIAHDFNNVLMPIMGLPGVLLDSPGLLDNKSEVVAALESILSAARDAREIIRRLREFYRPGDVLETGQVAVKDLVARAIALTEPAWKAQAQADGKAIRIGAEVQDTLTIQGNESGLREMLTNLIINAVHAIPSEGVIRLGARRDGDWAVIEVADTGTGMPEEVLRHCFEPFYTTKGERGSGLGLSMCHGIVERHGGRIEVASELNRGTTFTIRLPVKGPSRAPAAPGAKRLGAEVPSGLRVLVVDDEEVSRLLLTQYLTRAKCAVVTATGGADGLAKLRSGTFDLAIIDRAMPGVGGDEVARATRRDAPGTAVLMLTGFGDLMKCAGVRPEGVDEVLGKPVMPAELMQAIARVMSGKGGRQHEPGSAVGSADR